MTMGFFVFGINHQDCPVAVRERLHFSAAQTHEALAKLKKAPEISEMMILSTCNRVDFYGVGESPSSAERALTRLIEQIHGVPASEYNSFLYRFEGKEALRHIFQVAAGLNSMVVGESEILGQFREAFLAANQSGSMHSLLYRLVERALKVGKEVRTQTKINQGAVSVPSVAVELAEKIFGKLRGEKVMVLGTGDMSLLTFKSLKQEGADILYVVSRNRETGQDFAAQCGAQWVSFEDWPSCLERVDIVIAATSAPHPVIHFEQVKAVMEARRHRPLFLMDIAVPRDVEPEVNTLDGVYLYNIDDLKGVSSANLRLRRREVRVAETLVDKAVDDFQGWLEQLKARPALERFEQLVDEILAGEIKRFAKKTGASETDQEELIRQLRAKLLHLPREKIKEASLNGGVERYLEALAALFYLDDHEP